MYLACSYIGFISLMSFELHIDLAVVSHFLLYPLGMRVHIRVLHFDRGSLLA